MIIDRTRKTTRSKCFTPRRTALPESPRACTAKPMSRATNSVCSTESPTKGETSVVGMIPSRKSTVLPCSAAGALAPDAARCRPAPGWSRLPTTRPMTRATVDMIRK
jgi:hypothetical protein